MNNRADKVLFIISSLNMGGTELRLVDVLLNLDAKQFDPHLFVAKGKSSLLEKLNPNQVSIGTKWSNVIFSIWKLGFHIWFNRPEIIWCIQPGVTSFLGQLFAWISHTPVTILSIHGSASQDNRIDLLNKFISKIANTHFVVVSHELKKQLVKMDIPSKQITTIYNGVDIDLFYPRHKPFKLSLHKASEHQYILGTVGNLREVKGHHILIQSIKIVKERYPNILLIIAGEGDRRSKLENMIIEYNLEYNVKLLGIQFDIPNLMRTMDIFAFSSLSEGLPNSILEAMATGLPIVSTDVGGIPELITKDVGILVPPNDAQALADAICDLIASPNKRQLLGEKARLRVLQNFTFRSMIREREKLFIDLLNKN